jgi:hypothetical protein
MWVLKETGRSCYKNQGLQRRRIHDPMKSFGKCFSSSVLHELRTNNIWFVFGVQMTVRGAEFSS